MTCTPTIAVLDLRLAYGQKEAIRGISFEILRNEIFGIKDGIEHFTSLHIGRFEVGLELLKYLDDLVTHGRELGGE